MAHGRKYGIEQEAAPDDKPEFAVRKYSVQEIAEAWKLGVDTVRAIFQNEPGVIAVPAQNTRGISRRRGYTTLRIPEPVVARVYERMKVKAKAS
jgi:hypothetical protein